MKILFILLISGSFLWGVQRTQVHMGTLINVNVEDENLSDEVFFLFGDLDKRLSTYKSDSEISRLNRTLDLNVSEVTRKVLERSMQMSRISHGAFDVTIGSLTHEAYRFGYEDEHLPSGTELQRLKKMVGYKRMMLKGERVTLLPGTIIDLGGIGKGYAVDIAIAMLRSKGVKKAIVAASGDISCLGECNVTIADPFHAKGSIAQIQSTLPRFAISTSGNYERYIKNKTYNHLIDPKTGKSEQIFASVTLMSETDNTALDALSTAVAVMGEKKAIELLRSMPNIAYYLVRNDGKVLQSRKLDYWKGIRFSREN